MSLAPSYNLDVEIFKKKKTNTNYMCICVFKRDKASGQCIWRVVGGV